METVLKLCGRFNLIRTEQGYCWCWTAESGVRWYWHPDVRQWTAHGQASPTEADATVGLDWTLSHEKAGDLNHLQDTPPAHHGTSGV